MISGLVIGGLGLRFIAWGSGCFRLWGVGFRIYGATRCNSVWDRVYEFNLASRHSITDLLPSFLTYLQEHKNDEAAKRAYIQAMKASFAEKRFSELRSILTNIEPACIHLILDWRSTAHYVHVNLFKETFLVSGEWLAGGICCS